MATAGIAAGARAGWRTGRAQVAFLGLLLFVVVLYTNPSYLVPAIGDHGYAKMVAALALGALGVSWLLEDRPLHLGGTTGWLLLGLFALVAASALWSFWPSLTVDTLLDGLKYLAIFFLVANVVDSAARVRIMLHGMAWASLVPALGAIRSWLMGENLVEGNRAAWIGLFGNPNDLAYYLVVGLAVTLGAREISRRRGVRLAYLGALSILATALLLTQSRGGLIAAGAVVGIWFVLGLRRRRGILGIGITLLLVFSAAPEVVWQRASSTFAYRHDVSAQGRIDAWRTGWRMALDRPLGGVGAGAFMVAWPTYAPGDAGPARTAHNTYVQLLAETGVPSLFLFLGAVGASLWGLRRRRLVDAALHTPARALQVGLGGFLVAGATGGLAYSWPLYLLLGLASAVGRARNTT